MNEAGKPSRKRSWLSILFNVVLCVLILAAALVLSYGIKVSEPKAEQINTVRKSAALVETVIVQKGTFSPRLVVLGTVEPAQDILLSPRVGGQVIGLSPGFVPGGMVRQGDLLLTIDPADFENALLIRESELEQAQASLKIEEGRVSLAEQELALLEESISETNRALVLREPQFASMKAEVKAAEAAVQRAKLDLERAKVVAPFDAQVINRSVNIGSQVMPGDALGQLVGIDEYWVIAAIPVRSLRWVQFPGVEHQGSAVTLSDPDVWGTATRPARVTRMIGALDEQTRLARVLITVPDPLGQKSQSPVLILDTFIEAQIEGRPIKDVVRLNRDYVRDRGSVWVMKDQKLEIRETEIVFQDSEHAYIRRGLADGDEVVMTTLATVANGVGLRRVETSRDAGDSSLEEATD
ncbi:MAG: efflux RND transporter periplasmic adaptor subunit [Planctomycetaceae bacterium]|nr:efflux RND transporter periplasmic adaptor subunit [Planctomycetaceae bacterium]